MNQALDMFKATKVDIKLIGPEVAYKAGVDVMMMRAPIYWSRLGSSKTKQQNRLRKAKRWHKILLETQHTPQ